MIAYPPHAAIVIPHYNDPARLALCLAALAPQVADGRVEVVVVDNGSDDDPAPLQARFAWARFLSEPEKGAAPARNRGVAETGAPLLFFTDADCIPAPDWVATALALCGAGGPDGTGQEWAGPDWSGVIGGRVDVFDETPPPRSGAEAFETVFAFDQRDYVTRKRFSVTANLLTTRAVFDATGPFRGRVSEDLDWCQRAVGQGYPIRYADDLRVRHPTRSDWPALRRKWRRIVHELFGVHGRTPRARLTWALRACAMAGSGVWHAGRVLRHPALTPGEKWRGTLTLLRLRLLRAAWMLGQALRGA